MATSIMVKVRVLMPLSISWKNKYANTMTNKVSARNNMMYIIFMLFNKFKN
jgi:hypothetical protein